MMFRGVNQVNLDSKGRIAIPTRYREELRSDADSHMVVTVNITDRCLWLYTLPEWERIEADVTALPSFDNRAAKLKRFFIGQATEADMDASGRLLLPPPLREFAQLEKRIVLAGQGMLLGLAVNLSESPSEVRFALQSVVLASTPFSSGIRCSSGYMTFSMCLAAANPTRSRRRPPSQENL